MTNKEYYIHALFYKIELLHLPYYSIEVCQHTPHNTPVFGIFCDTHNKVIIYHFLKTETKIYLPQATSRYYNNLLED